MRFHTFFQRYKGTPPANVATALGADAVPAAGIAPNQKTMDNVLFCPFQNVNGWPCHRVAVVFNQSAGTPNASKLQGQMFFYEHQTSAWHAIGAAVDITANVVTFFDVVALLTRPVTGANIDASQTGSIEQMLVITDAHAVANGTYDFAIGADLTTTP